MMTRSVAIFAYDQMEALDFAGPFEVFTTASRVAQNRGDDVPFRVFSVADSARVKARAGLTILADHQLREVQQVDVLLIPGGVIHDVEADERVTAWLRQLADTTELTASVCTGVFLLAAAAIVTDHEVTTHWEDVDDLAARYPQLRVRRGVRWVDQGPVVTSAGISAGIDMSLHLVRRLVSDELARATATQMEYDWRPESDDPHQVSP
jgi:transcriptional regulator GlxA family with amidase domain